jgi:hypothetical protein
VGEESCCFFTGVWICKKATGRTKNNKKWIENRFMLNPGLYSFFLCAKRALRVPKTGTKNVVSPRPRPRRQFFSRYVKE